MVIIGLVLLGLCLGSFVNATVWRVYEQAKQQGKKKPDAAYIKDLSISRGRSMCPHCRHTLGFFDLIPVVSWLALRGKCRYCGKPVSVQYPLVELVTAGVFVASYIWWPHELGGAETAVFGLWLVFAAGLMALLVYDARWYLLPNRLLAPTALAGALLACVEAAQAADPLKAVFNTALGVLVGGGVFYLLFQVSAGKWIGGGDVKLGAVLGLVLATPAKAMLMIFIASVVGTLVSLPLLVTHRLKPKSTIPFGPLLIVAALITQLFGQGILDWYVRTFIPGF
jgi:prepilin signal peptidase PulO-like enzyme (type II secretory pathway)